MTRMVDSFWLGITVTGAGLAILHWAPWHKPLHKLVAYALGTGSILLGQFLWLGWGREFWLLAAFPLVAGFVTVLAYYIDQYANYKRRVELSSHERD